MSIQKKWSTGVVIGGQFAGGTRRNLRVPAGKKFLGSML